MTARKPMPVWQANALLSYSHSSIEPVHDTSETAVTSFEDNPVAKICSVASPFSGRLLACDLRGRSVTSRQLTNTMFDHPMKSRDLRPRSRHLSFALLLVTFLITACGGGGSATPAPPPPPPSSSGPTAEELANAKAAALSAKLDLATATATLSWTDTFANESGYRIERLNGSVWETLDTVSGQSGSQQTLTWSGAISATTTYRVEAVLATYNVPLAAATAQQNQIVVALPSAPPAIQLNQSEPVAGTVGVSISGGGQYNSVNYFVDLTSIGVSASPPDYATTWNASSVAPGSSHLLIAQLATGPDSYVEIRRIVQVAQVSVQLISESSFVRVVAKSPAGIQVVAAELDGTSLGSLTTPNGDNSTEYVFTIPPGLIVSGPHTFTAQATDLDGKTASATTTLTFNNPPKLVLDSPVEGSLVHGTLHIAGTFSSDKPGILTLRATLGDTPVLTASSSPFSIDYDLTGLPQKSYQLTVTVTDSTGLVASASPIVIVTSPSAVVSTPILQIHVGSAGTLLGADDKGVLYEASVDEFIHLWSVATDTNLQKKITSGPTQWRLTNGHAFALDTSTVGSSNVDVYHWSPGSAAPQNLGLLGGRSSGALRAAHWPWVLGSAGSTFVFYDAETAQTIAPSLVNPNVSPDPDIDFSVGNGGITLFYGSNLTDSGGTGIGIRQWDQGSGQSISIAEDYALWQINQQTDGTRLAWQVGPRGTKSPPYSLKVLDIASGIQQVLSTTMNADPTRTDSARGQFYLADGLLAWGEGTTSNGAIEAWDGTTVTTVSSLGSSKLYGVGGGYVLFVEDSKLYVWSAAAGRRLLLDTTPIPPQNYGKSPQIHGKTVYFMVGRNLSLHRITLD